MGAIQQDRWAGLFFLTKKKQNKVLPLGFFLVALSRQLLNGFCYSHQLSLCIRYLSLFHLTYVHMDMLFFFGPPFLHFRQSVLSKICMKARTKNCVLYSRLSSNYDVTVCMRGLQTWEGHDKSSQNWTSISTTCKGTNSLVNLYTTITEFSLWIYIIGINKQWNLILFSGQ